MPGAPFTDYIILVFLVMVLVLIAIDYPVGTFTFGSLIIVIPLMIMGWFACRENILRIASERQGYTGVVPIVAKLPVTQYLKEKEQAD